MPGIPYFQGFPAYLTGLVFPWKTDITASYKGHLGTLERRNGNTLKPHGNNFGNTYCRIATEHTSLLHNKKPAFKRVYWGFTEQLGRRRNARYFPMQKRLKMTPSKSSAVNSPVISPSDCCARRNSSANSSSAGI